MAANRQLADSNGITGLWIGIMSMCRRRKAGAPIIPYRGMMRWHHITGLVFGLVAITWVFSGLLSMNPGDLNPSRSPTAEQALVFNGKELTPEDFIQPIVKPRNADVIEAELTHVDGAPFYLAVARDGSEHLVPADGRAPPAPTMEALIERARLLLPDWPISHASVLDEYDNYWYSRNPELNGQTLPVIRVQFADPDDTWFYIDPEKATVLRKLTRANRVYRWLYNGLHSWDIRWLYERRPLWDIAVITFSLGGLALSLIGMVVSWRRLRLEKHSMNVRRRRRHDETALSAG